MAQDPSAPPMDVQKYLAEKQGPSAAPPMDVSQYLQEKSSPPPQQGIGERIVRGALKTLPAAGAIVGGLLATPETLGLGTLPGAAVGGVAGKSLEDTLEKYLFDQGPKSRMDQYKGLALSGKDAMEQEMGGQIISGIPGMLKSGVNSGKEFIASKLGQNIDAAPVANKDAILEAAKNIGINDVPKAVTTGNQTYQKLESGLSQSGSSPAKPIRDQYNNFFKGVDQATGKIADLKTPDSDFALGGQIQKGMADEVGKMRAPVSEMYSDLVPQLKKIPVDQGIVNQQFGALKRDPLFATQDGKAMLDEYKGIVADVPELASLKETRSTIGQSLSKTAAPIEQSRVSAIQQAITNIRDKSINATKLNLPKDMHGEVDDFINQVALADAAHASNIKDINSVKGILGNKNYSSPSTFLSDLGSAKEGELVDRASNLDVGSMRNLQDKFPSIFDKAKTAKINDMISRSTNPSSGFNENTFLKQYNQMDPEMKNLLFDSKMQNHIDSLQTLKQAIPDKLGPSGTPEGQMTMDMFNPKRIAQDYGIKKVLENTADAGAQKIADAVPAAVPDNVVGINSLRQNSSPLMQSLDVVKPIMADASSPSAFMQRAADARKPDDSKKADAPLKGSDKWASDGVKNLLLHTDDPAARAILTDPNAVSDPKVKEQLIKASDLKPGTKAMENVLSKITSMKSGDQ